MEKNLCSSLELEAPKSCLASRFIFFIEQKLTLKTSQGALLLSPVNEFLGRRMAIIISIMLYTIGAALEAGSVSFGMIVGGRVILGLGVGLEGGKSFAKLPSPISYSYEEMVSGVLLIKLADFITLGTVPVYVAETVERRIRGNLVSLYQFNIALGEVFGYVVAAIFLNIKGNW